MSSLTSCSMTSSASLPIDQWRKPITCHISAPSFCSLRANRFYPRRLELHLSQFQHLSNRQLMKRGTHKSSSLICAIALNATCAAEQTQTVTRQSSTITVAPVQGKEKSPELDDGGTGFPPRDDGDGGGGGGGGGSWSGGFFFFGFLAFLGFLKDQESEETYTEKRRR